MCAFITFSPMLSTLYIGEQQRSLLERLIPNEISKGALLCIALPRPCGTTTDTQGASSAHVVRQCSRHKKKSPCAEQIPVSLEETQTDEKARRVLQKRKSPAKKAICPIRHLKAPFGKCSTPTQLPVPVTFFWPHD